MNNTSIQNTVSKKVQRDIVNKIAIYIGLLGCITMFVLF